MDQIHMPGIIGERGQITIEKAIRDQLGIKPRDIAVQHLEDGRLVITFLPAPHRRSLRGALRPRPRKPIEDFSQIRDLLEQEIAKAESEKNE